MYKAHLALGGGVLYPSLSLNFCSDESLDSRIAFTRASPATYRDSSFTLQQVASNVARSNQYADYDKRGNCLGFLLEEQRSNFFLNSQTPATQSIGVANVPYTLSFYGTGTITLSGASTAGPLVGTGDDDLVQLTFTPSIGTLTVTISGAVTNVQVEQGAFATSRIITTGSTATRAADSAVMTGSNFSSWYNQEAGTFVVELLRASPATGTASAILSVSDNSTVNFSVFQSRNAAPIGEVFMVSASSVSQASLTMGTLIANGASFKMAGAYKANDFAASLNGATAVTDSSGSVPLVDRMYIGGSVTDSSKLNGAISSITYYPKRLTNAQIQHLSA